MRKLALAVAMLVVTGTSALADGSIKDAPVVVAPTWEGAYVGLQIGGLWADWNSSNAISDPGIGPFTDPGFPLGGFDGSGVTGGMHFGFNHQMGSFVGGFEVDLNFTNADDTRNFLAVGVPPGLPLTIKQSIDSYGTVRARAGYARDRVLVYATGGVAWAAVESSLTSPGQFAGPFATGDRHMLTGWTAGAGVSYMISPQWLLALEYKHIDLGDKAYTYTFPFAGGTPVTTHIDLVMDEVTLRLSRKF